MTEPVAYVIVPRWVRVLAFLRVPFARRRMLAAKWMQSVAPGSDRSGPGRESGNFSPTNGPF